MRLFSDATMLRALTAVWATEISMTPKTLMAMAMIVPRLIVSDRKISANSAACAGSVRE